MFWVGALFSLIKKGNQDRDSYSSQLKEYRKLIVLQAFHLCIVINFNSNTSIRTRLRKKIKKKQTELFIRKSGV